MFSIPAYEQMTNRDPSHRSERRASSGRSKSFPVTGRAETLQFVSVDKTWRNKSRHVTGQSLIGARLFNPSDGSTQVVSSRRTSLALPTSNHVRPSDKPEPYGYLPSPETCRSESRPLLSILQTGRFCYLSSPGTSRAVLFHVEIVCRGAES